MITRFVVLAVISVLALVGLFVALRPNSPSTGPQKRTVNLEIHSGEMKPAEISAQQGDRVTLKVSSDQAVEFHVHGYDLEKEVKPGNPVNLSFKADLTGRFPVEDHNTEKELGTLTVRPRQ